VAHRVAILLDGGFVKKTLPKTTGHFPTVAEVVGLATTVMAKPALASHELFRVYFYDAPPYEGKAQNPVTGVVENFSATVQSAQNKGLIDALELQPNFAVRRGFLILSGWKLGRNALRSLAKAKRPITSKDIVPDMSQKCVDMKIGLDMAWLALRRIVECVVLVTGDSDFVPVMKFARREGLKVYLDCLGHPVRRELKAHADIIL
jgi:uncharacterized LabA/DUF88 family protein